MSRLTELSAELETLLYGHDAPVMERHHDVGFPAGKLAFAAELSGFRCFTDRGDRSRLNLLGSDQRRVSLHSTFLVTTVSLAAGCLHLLRGQKARRRDDCGMPICLVGRVLDLHPREALDVEAGV
ncbi:MAG: hypothetical protein OXK79_08415, partial [Chloroflexota bacterium]|nr:hypothetical protein [Chloroflexota bacterium]